MTAIQLLADALMWFGVVTGVGAAVALVTYGVLDVIEAFREDAREQAREEAARRLENVVQMYAPARSQSVQRFMRPGR